MDSTQTDEQISEHDTCTTNTRKDLKEQNDTAQRFNMIIVAQVLTPLPGLHEVSAVAFQ